MAKKATVAKKKEKVEPVMQTVGVFHQQNIELLPPQVMDTVKAQIEMLMNEFQNISDNNLISLQRRRKIGTGIRNYGFIDEVSDLAEANPQYAQFFNIADLKNCIRNIEVCRELVILLQSFARMASNSLMVYGDEAIGMALIYYNMVKEMSRRGDPMAMPIFKTLQPFFKKHKRAGAEPTAKQVERDARAILHGKKDGKIIVENISPKTTAGVRKVVDDVKR
jgi:hypothetical protein